LTWNGYFSDKRRSPQVLSLRRTNQYASAKTPARHREPLRRGGRVCAALLIEKIPHSSNEILKILT
jgi:hypothetical protein